jgi:hypothetical protein
LPRSTKARVADVASDTATPAGIVLASHRAGAAPSSRFARVALDGPRREAGVVRDAGTWRLAEAGVPGAATVRVAGLPRRAVTVRFEGPLPLGWNREVRVSGEWRAVPSRGVHVADGVVDVRVSAAGGAEPLPVQWLEARWERAQASSSERGVSGYVRVESPDIITRSEWGAHTPPEPYNSHRPEAIVVHHSWLPTQEHYARTGGAESVEGIQRFHMFDPTRGWNDVGYHYLIGPDGLVFAGRPPGVVGAHAVPNTGKVGICMIGNHDPDGAAPTAEAWRALEKLVASLADRFDIPMTELYGHRNFSYKTCPGDLVYERFSELRMEVRRRIGTMGDDK